VSEPDSATVARIRAITAELDRSLRRLRLSRADRQTIVGEVRGDLETATADGVSPEALIGPDVDAFARAAVEAAGYRPRAQDYPRILSGGVLGAGVAVVAAYLLIVELLQPALASWFDLDGRFPSLGPAVVFGGIAVVAVLGTLGALGWLLAGRSAARATVTRAALLVPIAAATGLAAVVAVGRDPDYTLGVPTVIGQALLVLVPVVAALSFARWWALRTAADGDHPVHASPASN
jgi:hypothetical protein